MGRSMLFSAEATVGHHITAQAFDGGRLYLRNSLLYGVSDDPEA